MNARQKYREPGLRVTSRAADAMHVNYYKRRDFWNPDVTKEDIDDVEKLVHVLRPFIA